MAELDTAQSDTIKVSTTEVNTTELDATQLNGCGAVGAGKARHADRAIDAVLNILTEVGATIDATFERLLPARSAARCLGLGLSGSVEFSPD